VKPILTADCVGKSFNGRAVLTSATLRAVPGELRVMFGRNGAGKSTLLKIAAARLAPDSGAIHFGGRVSLRVSPRALAVAGLFYLPDHDLLSNGFTVRRQLEMIRRRFDGGDPVRAAERVGVDKLIDNRPFELSSGELRRAEIAAALVRRPTCLLADEPFRGIAPRDAEDLTDVLRELAATGAAVVITGHEVSALLDAADHVTWCTSGTTLELGPPATAAQHHGFRRDYLGGWYRSTAV
jgi:lipopolysaccharide export system ATP-binding protein